MCLLLLALIQGRGGGALLWLVMVAVTMGRISCDLAAGADESWLLMVEDGRGDSEDRRITPKSVFIAPSINSRAHQRCKEGFSFDHLGRCVKVVRVNPTAQFDLFRQRLQTARPPSLIAKLAPAPSTGPLHFSLPLGNLDSNPAETVPKTKLPTPENNTKLSADNNFQITSSTTISPTIPSLSSITSTSSIPLGVIPLPSDVAETPPDKLLDLFLQRLRGVAVVRENNMLPSTTEIISTTETVRLASPSKGVAESADDQGLTKALDSLLHPSEKPVSVNLSALDTENSAIHSSGESPIGGPGEGSGDWATPIVTTNRIPLLEELRPEQEDSRHVNPVHHPDFVRSAEQLNNNSSPPPVHSSYNLDEGVVVPNGGLQGLPSDTYRTNDGSVTISNSSVFQTTEQEDNSATTTDVTDIVTSTEEDLPTTTELNVETTTLRFPAEESTTEDPTTVVDNSTGQDISTLTMEEFTTSTVHETSTIDQQGETSTTTDQQGETLTADQQVETSTANQQAEAFTTDQQVGTSRAQQQRTGSTFWVPYIEKVNPSGQNIGSISEDGSKFILEASGDDIPQLFLYEALVTDARLTNNPSLQLQSVKVS